MCSLASITSKTSSASDQTWEMILLPQLIVWDCISRRQSSRLKWSNHQGHWFSEIIICSALKMLCTISLCWLGDPWHCVSSRNIMHFSLRALWHSWTSAIWRKVSLLVTNISFYLSCCLVTKGIDVHRHLIQRMFGTEAELFIILCQWKEGKWQKRLCL